VTRNRPVTHGKELSPPSIKNLQKEKLRSLVGKKEGTKIKAKLSLSRA
jgi:hypothetical protein